MKNQTFKEILQMIDSACNSIYYAGSKGKENTVIECATRIYIAQMNGVQSEPKERES